MNYQPEPGRITLKKIAYDSSFTTTTVQDSFCLYAQIANTILSVN